MKSKNRIILDILIPCLVLVIVTIVLAITEADIRIESIFYQPGNGWIHANDIPWHLLYKYGALPGLLLGAAAVSVFAAGFFSARFCRFRKLALYFLLVLALGPGLITSVFKSEWGRPRPRQVDTFGGEQKFLEVWQKGIGGQGPSFPSSHAAIAFYLFSPYLPLRRSSPRLSMVFLIAGLLYGSLMGLARMIQGGHFPSDVLWAGGLVYLTGVVLYYALGLDRGAVGENIR